MTRIAIVMFGLVCAAAACSSSEISTPLSTCGEFQDLDAHRTDGGIVSLPTSRNTTYAVGSQVKSADLNDLQDNIIGMKFPSHWRWQGFPRAGRETGVAFDNTGGLYNGCIRATAAMSYEGGVITGLPVGTYISGLKAEILGTGGAQTVTVALSVVNLGTGAMSTVGSIAVVNPAAAIATFTSDPVGSPTTLADGDILIVSAFAALSGTHINRFGLKVSRL